METQEVKESIIRIQDLKKVEPLCINLEEVGVGQEGLGLSLENIEIPPQFNQKFTPNARILDGFIQGALKNIINFSESMIWVYEVSRNSITLLSYTAIEGEELRKIFQEESFEVNNKVISDQENFSSVQLIFEKLQKEVNLRFDYKSGKLLKQKFLKSKAGAASTNSCSLTRTPIKTLKPKLMFTQECQKPKTNFQAKLVSQRSLERSPS